MRLLIIGGSDAGISAALRARELAPSTQVQVIVRDRFPNFSICGLPFFLSGETPDWHHLAHRTTDDIRREGIDLLLEHEAIGIDPQHKIVTVSSLDGEHALLVYDKLVIGTGAESANPPISGLGLPGVHMMRWMSDAFRVKAYLDQRLPRSVVIVGAGYIGLEMADALTRLGIDVTVIEYLPQVLRTVDVKLGRLVRAELERHGVKVITSTAVASIEGIGDQLSVMGREGVLQTTDMVLVAAGARPETSLAESAGVKLGPTGAIRVSRRMETSVADVFAAGDCVETWHRVRGGYSYLPLGTTAHKQGRIAGENAVGGTAEYAGSLGTQAVKVFDLVVARTGLRDDEAAEIGFRPLTVDFETWDHKVYYPRAQKLRIRLTADQESGKLLGAQLVGHRTSEVSKRVDILAAALFHEMSVEELSELDLSYTPPLSSPWDPVQMAAQAWESKAWSLASGIQEKVQWDKL